MSDSEDSDAGEECTNIIDCDSSDCFYFSEEQKNICADEQYGPYPTALCPDTGADYYYNNNPKSDSYTYKPDCPENPVFMPSCNGEWNDVTVSHGKHCLIKCGKVCKHTHLPVYNFTRNGTYNGDPISCCLSGQKGTFNTIGDFKQFTNQLPLNDQLKIIKPISQGGSSLLIAYDGYLSNVNDPTFSVQDTSETNQSPIDNINLANYTCDPAQVCEQPFLDFCTEPINMQFWKNAVPTKEDEGDAWQGFCGGTNIKANKTWDVLPAIKNNSQYNEIITDFCDTSYGNLPLGYDGSSAINIVNNANFWLEKKCIPTDLTNKEEIISTAIQNIVKYKADILISQDPDHVTYITNLLSYLDPAFPLQDTTTTSALNELCSIITEDNFVQKVDEGDKINTQIKQNIIKACGCHMDPANYSSKFPNINYNCSSYCNNSYAIQDKDNPCKSTSCLIDDFSIDLYNDHVGSINFSQLCGTCKGTGNCSCFITDSSFSADNSTITDSLNIKQNCSTCSTETDKNCLQSPSDPPSSSPGTKPSTKPASGNNNKLIFLILGISLVIILISALILFL